MEQSHKDELGIFLRGVDPAREVVPAEGGRPTLRPKQALEGGREAIDVMRQWWGHLLADLSEKNRLERLVPDARGPGAAPAPTGEPGSGGVPARSCESMRTRGEWIPATTMPIESHSSLDRLCTPSLIRLRPSLFALQFVLMKMVPARFIAEKAMENWALRQGELVVESSSGTFALELAIVCANLGVNSDRWPRWSRASSMQRRRPSQAARAKAPRRSVRAPRSRWS